MTCLHSECGTNSQYGEENYEWDQPRGWGTVAWIRDRPDDNQKEERCEELQREKRTDEDSDNGGHQFGRVYLIEEAVRARHVWRLNGASEDDRSQLQ